MYLRRLTNQEYAATVHDLLGVEPVVDTLPPNLTLHGFDNNAESISISTAHLEGYRAIAESLASDLVASVTRRQAIAGCDPSSADSAKCLETFIRQFGLRAFRRPLTDEEVSALLMLSKASLPPMGPWNPIGLVVEALLQSPSFLFRVEVGKVDPARPDRVRLTGHEVATRLSYLLWGTMPDNRLFEAANSGALDSAEGVEAQALRISKTGPGRKRRSGRSRDSGCASEISMQWTDPPPTSRSGAKRCVRPRPRRLDVWSMTTPAGKARRFWTWSTRRRLSSTRRSLRSTA